MKFFPFTEGKDCTEMDEIEAWAREGEMGKLTGLQSLSVFSLTK